MRKLRRRAASIAAGALLVLVPAALLFAPAAGAAPPTANDDVLVVAEDGLGTADVLANDSDPDNDALTIVNWTPGTHGFVDCNAPPANCRYQPNADFFGPDGFTYTISDGQGGEATATVTVTVTSVNDPPVASPDEVQLTGGTGSVDVLLNDFDLEGDALTVSDSTDGSFGAVTCAGGGSCTYTAGPSFAGVDSFTYDVSDGNGGVATGTVEVCGAGSAAPSALAGAIAGSFVSSASYAAHPPCGQPNDVSTTPLAGFPTSGPSYAILTSGDARLADDPNTTTNAGANLDGPAVRGNSAFDVTILKVDLDVPQGRNCLTFDFRFLSEEFPEFVVSDFNDAFIAELDDSTWTAVGSAINAPNNFAFDAAGNEISIKSTGATGMTSGAAAGTTYDGATPLLAASTPIAPGPHSLYLSLFDQRDRVFDSAVFVDGLVLGTTAPGGCTQGATVLGTTKTADSPTSVAGGTNGYTITVANTSSGDVTLDSVFDVLPAGFSYVAGTTTGATTSNPTVAAQTLTWAGPFTVPASGSLTLSFDVTVSSTPGQYFNDAGGDAAGNVAVTPTGPTAPITVTSPPSADLSITKTDSPDPVEVGQNLTYTLTVANTGPDAAQDVAVSDTLPAGVSFVSASAGCTGTSTVTCDLDEIADGASTSVTIDVVPTQSGVLTNTATVASTTADPVTGNNTSTATTAVDPVSTGPMCNGLRATIVGGPGKDDIQGTPGVDVIVDLGGNNYVQTGGGSDHVCLGPGKDEVDSGDGDDFVAAGEGKNRVKTGNGNDTVRSGSDQDEIDTGDGNDVVVDLGGKNKIVTGNGGDHVTSGSGNDQIETGNGADVVLDSGGNNKVVTGDGDDRITTGAGNDEVDGGNGFDLCSPGAGNNRVKDCEGGDAPG